MKDFEIICVFRRISSTLVCIDDISSQQDLVLVAFGR